MYCPDCGTEMEELNVKGINILNQEEMKYCSDCNVLVDESLDESKELVQEDYLVEITYSCNSCGRVWVEVLDRSEGKRALMEDVKHRLTLDKKGTA